MFSGLITFQVTEAQLHFNHSCWKSKFNYTLFTEAGKENRPHLSFVVNF